MEFDFYLDTLDSQFNFNFLSETYTIDVSVLADYIEQNLGLLPFQQEFYFQGKKVTEVDLEQISINRPLCLVQKPDIIGQKITLIKPTGEPLVFPVENPQFISGYMLKQIVDPELPYYDICQISLMYQNTEIQNEDLLPKIGQYDHLNIKIGIEKPIEKRRIQIWDYIGNQHELEVNIGISVKEIKKIMRDKLLYAIETMQLIYNGTELEDKKPLTMYYLKHEPRLTLVKLNPKKRPYPLYTLTAEQSLREVDQRFEIPNTWRIISPGLIALTKCQTEYWQAFDKEIWVLFGFGIFNLANLQMRWDIWGQVAPRPHALGFVAANWTSRRGENQEQYKSSFSQFQSFPDFQQGWEKLKVLPISELDTYDYSHTRKPRTSNPTENELRSSYDN